MKTKFIIIMIMLFANIIKSQERIAILDSVLNSLYATNKLNGNILIAEKGKVIYKKSYGYANEKTKQKIDENTVFELASCSKQFTAMAIMILKEKGKLKLEDNISKYIPQLSFYNGITIRHLLNHTGGLPDYMEIMDSTFDKSKMATNKDIIEIFSKQQPKILFEPNSKYEYSNTGYALLASIIEKASGKSYADFLETNIFKVLNMTSSFVYTRRYQPKIIDNYAYGYIYIDSIDKYILPDSLEDTKMVIWLDGIVGDGCVNSTIFDLLKWDRALYTNKLLSKKSMEEIFEAATLNDNTKTMYGLGFTLENKKEFGKTASHGGSWPGYLTYIDRHLDNDKTIIILQNHNNVKIPIKTIRNILYNIPLPIVVARKEIKLSKNELEKYIGTYEIEKDVEIKILIDDNQLYTQLTGQDAIPIFAESELSFFLKVVDAQIQFKQNDKGEFYKLQLLQNGNKIEANRIK